MTKNYAKVAVENVNCTFDKEYDYSVPPELSDVALPGSRVTVPFGNGNKKRVGIITALCDTTENKRTKSISAVLDEAPLLSNEMLSLARWLSEQTFCTYYEAVKAMLPTGINHRIVRSFCARPDVPSEKLEALSPDERRVYEYLLSRSGYIKPESFLKVMGLDISSDIPERLLKKGILAANDDAVRNLSDNVVKMVRLCTFEPDMKLTKKQQEVVDVLCDTGTVSVREICYFTGFTPSVVYALEKKGIVECFDQEVLRSVRSNYADLGSYDSDDIELTDEQQKAFDGLLNDYNSNGGKTSLLYGVTGSGKTSVYLKLIDEVLASGKEVIVMVPEISLTPQTLSVFHSRYKDCVAVFHSALSAGERTDEWKRVKNKEAKIAIGTRSAVFAPFENLGLIIIDEEQEHTYKSEQTPRYSAKNVARFRTGWHGGLTLLASATPSVESFAAAKTGKYSFYELKNRYGGAILPEVVTVDMRNEQSKGNHSQLSEILKEELSENLKDKKQSIVLINRRGYNTFVSCTSCGHVVTCPNCSISMTYHVANGRLMCHYCGYSVKFTQDCPECKEPALKYSGFGTQKIEDELEKVLSSARVVRMDTDTTSSRFAHEEQLSKFAAGDYDIMVGTQMVAKGLDFENVTLAAVVSVDQQLYNDDFRSMERTFSLLTQVVGRSGRGKHPGKAIIQTLTPENEIIKLAAKQDYDAFYNTEIRLRKLMIYPPFCDICVVGFSGEDEMRTRVASQCALDKIKELTAGEYKDEKIIVLGPLPARVPRVNKKYRYRLIIKCKNTAGFREMMSKILTDFYSDKRFSSVSVYADMNPEITV
ncbi:MAG: primosomal protein N' [Oscillospiraceae bacterium]|nr:primosomal protein N' [Oscillospiraceae bacterium]